jgi:hypothetical protein
VEKSKAYIYDAEYRKEFASGKVDLDILLRCSRFLELFRDIKKEKIVNLLDDDLASAFLFLSHPDYSPVAWRWFLGEKLDRDERDAIMVNRSIVESKEAFAFLEAIFRLLRIIGIESIVLLVDEFEKIVLIPALARSQFQDDLRHLIDNNPKNLAILFATSPAQWDQMSKEPTALLRRLAGNVYLLDRFDEQRTRDLIAAYLEVSRTENFSKDLAEQKFPQCPANLCPFVEESINVILAVSKGTISAALLLCRKSLDYYLDHSDEYGAITRELVSAVAKQEGF